MKLLCIKESDYYLTKGKIYDGEPYDGEIFAYWVFNDNGWRHGVEENMFIELSKIRNDKLEALGI